MVEIIRPSDNQRGQFGFVKAVHLAFSFVQSYGFRCTKEETTFVRYESDTVFLNIYHGRSSYEIGAEIGRLNIDGEEAYYAYDIIHLVNPEEAENYRNYQAITPEAVEEGTKKLSEIFKKYSVPCMMSDQNTFNKLAEQQNQKMKKYWGGFLLREIRPKAKEAFRNKRYAEAIKLYESIDTELTPSERKKLEYARKHL